MLKWRLISAAVIISGLFGLLHLDVHHPLGVPGVWLLPLAIFVAIMMVDELLNMWRRRDDLPVRWPVYAGTILIVVATSVPLLWPLSGSVYPPDCPLGTLGWPLMGLMAGMGLAFVGEMSRYAQPGRSTGSIALSVLAMAYAGVPISFLVNLRLIHGPEWGMVALISLVVIVKLSDTGAYFVGRLVGKHKMAPVLSPGKTIEGSVGGLLSACLGAWICYGLIVPQLITTGESRGSLAGWLIFGLVVAIAGMVGDLAESLMKRDADCKDSSGWLRGLGGVLDVVDSIVFAAAPAYLCWASGLIGPH